MALQTSQSGSTAYGTFGSSCGLAYNYSTITDAPGSLTPWAGPPPHPDLASFSASLYFNSGVDGYWIHELIFACLKGTGSYGFFDTTGLDYTVSAHIGGNIITLSDTGFGLAGGLQTITIPINDFITTTDYVDFSVTCYYPPRIRSGVGFNRGWEFRDGGGPTPAFDLSTSTWPTGCSGGSWDVSIPYPWHSITYDPNIVRSDNSMGYSGSSAIAATYGVDIGSWQSSTDTKETYFLAEALRFAQSGSYSSIYRIDNFTKTCVIGIVTGSGQLDVQVSNDGSRFVTYDSITSDGYVEFKGFKYVRLYVDSGEVGAASIASQRKISRIDIEPVSSREPTRFGRLVSSRRGWGKGDM